MATPASADLVLGSPGTGAGQYAGPKGVAVDTEAGHIYVADSENNRVDVFDEAGGFLFAFGWKVNATTPEEKLQTCTSASGCQKGTSGSGAGQFKSLGSIAVDSASHVVYVAEEENHRVQKFDSEGHFLLMFGKGVNTGTSGKPDLCTNAGAPTDSCGAGTQGFGAGQFNQRVLVAIGPADVVYVVDSVVSAKNTNHFQRFAASGEPIEAPIELVGGYGDPYGLAIDSSGDLYFGESGYNESGKSLPGGVQKFDPTGHLVLGWGEGGKVDPTGNVHAIGLDPTGNLFVADLTQVRTEILEYDSSGAKTRVFFGNGTLEEFPIALAFYHDATGDLFAVEGRLGVSNPARVVQLALPPPGPLLVPGSTGASPVGSVKATLKVSFNAENKASKAHFQYISKAQFEADANSFGVGTQTTPDSAATPADFANHTVEAINTCIVPGEVTCLEPETPYYVRAIASNADGTVIGDKAEFTTRPSLEIGAIWATEVGTDVARLHAEVNPLGLPTNGRFEYVDDASFQSEGGFSSSKTQTTVGKIDFGSAEATLVRATQAYPLEPGTTYHYRLVAENPYFPPVISSAQTFTTFSPLASGEEECPVNAAFRLGTSTALPDCRAYEMVSPLDKDNGDILARINISGFPTNLDQSSTTGSGFTYSSYRAFANPQSAPYTNQFLASRDPEAGWSSESIDPPRGPQFRTEPENEYKAFSEDLSNGWLLQEGEPTLGPPCAPAGFADLYRRESASGAYQALSCAGPSQLFMELFKEPPAPRAAVVYVPELEGTSTDGSRAVFRIDDALTEDASNTTKNESGIRPIYQIYESSEAGELHLVSVLPDGKASNEDSSAGTALSNAIANHNREQIVDHAVSEDGSRVFWSAGDSTGGLIYLRTNADQKQSNVVAGQCTQPARACTIAVSETVTSERARFQTANPEGTEALFIVEAGPLKGNLYRFDAEAGPPASQLIGEGVVGNILGSSEDLSRVYFASEGATTQQQAEGAIKGEPNVYLADKGTIRFIATLSASGKNSDDIENPYGSPVSTTPIKRTAQVSANGASLVFMSNSGALSEKTASYDNTDAASRARCGAKNEKGEEGICDAEVYLYDAEANDGAGRLRCISCDPSGGRPDGREVGVGFLGLGLWAAAAIPVFESELYQSRYLSDDGSRVFFDSFDALVLNDTNGKKDVYQWEAAGSGRCTSQSPSYIPRSEGCLGLLSSGQSPSNSEFLDASANGSDVFFTTAESLLPQDYGLIDVYDAREGGGLPAPPAPPPACEGDSCQSPTPPPNDPTPASSSFEGAPNPAPRKRANKRKHEHKRKRAHRKHRREHRHHRRAVR